MTAAAAFRRKQQQQQQQYFHQNSFLDTSDVEDGPPTPGGWVVAEACKLKDGLFLGNIMAVQDGSFVLANKIGVLIKTQKGFVVPKRLKRFGVQYNMVNMLEVFMDPSSIPETKDACLDAFCRLLEEASDSGEGVLLYSFQDFLWSAFCVAAFLIKKYRWPVDKALSLVKQKRPNLVFDDALVDQLEQLATRVKTDPLADLDHVDVIAEEEMMTNTLENSKRNSDRHHYGIEDGSAFNTRPAKIRWVDDSAMQYLADNTSGGRIYGAVDPSEKRGILKRAPSPALGVRPNFMPTSTSQQPQQQQQQGNASGFGGNNNNNAQSRPLSSSSSSSSSYHAVQQQIAQQQQTQIQRPISLSVSGSNSLGGVSGISLARPSTPAMRMPSNNGAAQTAQQATTSSSASSSSSPAIERRVFGKRLPPSPRRGGSAQQELLFDDPITPSSSSTNNNNNAPSLQVDSIKLRQQQQQQLLDDDGIQTDNDTSTAPVDEMPARSSLQSASQLAARLGVRRAPSPGWLGGGNNNNNNNRAAVSNNSNNSSSLDGNFSGAKRGYEGSSNGVGNSSANGQRAEDTVGTEDDNHNGNTNGSANNNEVARASSATPTASSSLDNDWLWRYRLSAPSASSSGDDSNNNNNSGPLRGVRAMSALPRKRTPMTTSGSFTGPLSSTMPASSSSSLAAAAAAANASGNNNNNNNNSRFGAMRVTPSALSRSKIASRDDRPSSLGSSSLNSFLKIGANSASGVGSGDVNSSNIGERESGNERAGSAGRGGGGGGARGATGSNPPSLWSRVSSDMSNGNSNSNNNGAGNGGSTSLQSGLGMRAQSPTMSSIANRSGSSALQRPLSASAATGLNRSWNRSPSTAASRSRSFVWAR